MNLQSTLYRTQLSTQISWGKSFATTLCHLCHKHYSQKRISYGLRLFVYFVPSLSVHKIQRTLSFYFQAVSLSLSYAYIHKKLWSVDLLICEHGRKAYARGSVLWLWWRSIWFEGYFHIRCSFLQPPLNFVIWVYPCL